MDAMTEPATNLFSQVIQEHLDLKRRNAELEGAMPLSRYMEEDPFENHPLFKTEEQARIEETMSGQESIEDAPSPLAWPSDDTFVAEPEPAAAADDAAPSAEGEPDGDSEEAGLWSRSRDFDWGD
jgi:hypothetical protein